MIKAKWGQGAPYNRKCPKYEGSPLLAGCTAVAMAQIMHYYKSTNPCLGEIEYVNKGVGSKEISVDFTKSTYDWSNMLDVYEDGNYTDVQADAVAKLMFEAAASCKARFDVKLTGVKATSAAIPFVGFNYHYNYNCDVYYREYTPTDVWMKLIQDELTAGRPILYSGANGISAHAFVIDGIDAENNVHINWGWNGASDGYFDVTYCHAPEESRGYFKQQMMLTGIRPRTASDEPYSERLFHIGYNAPLDQYMYAYGITANCYESSKKLAFTLALTQNGKLKYIMPDYNYDNIMPCYPTFYDANERNKWFTVVDDKDWGVATSTVTDGEYELQAVYRNYGVDEKWTVLPTREYGRCFLTVKNGESVWKLPFADKYTHKGTVLDIIPATELIGKAPMYLNVTYQDESNRLPGVSPHVPVEFVNTVTGETFNSHNTASFDFDARYPGLLEEKMLGLRPVNDKDLGMPGGTYRIRITPSVNDFKLAKDFTVTLKPAVDYPILDGTKDAYTEDDVFYWGSKVRMYNPACNKSVNNVDGDVNVSIYAKSVASGDEVRLCTFKDVPVPSSSKTSFYLPNTLYPLEGEYELSMRYTTSDGERGLLNPVAEKKVITIRPSEYASVPHIASTSKTLANSDYLVKGKANSLTVPVVNNSATDFTGKLYASFLCKESGSYIEVEVQNVAIGAGANVSVNIPVTFPENGTYEMQITSLPASAQYATFVSAPDGAPVCYKVGVGEASVAKVETPALGIYPNPAFESICVAGLENTEEVTVISSTGVVMIRTFVGSDESIDVTGLPSGVYFVKVANAVMKFVKR